MNGVGKMIVAAGCVLSLCTSSASAKLNGSGAGQPAVVELLDENTEAILAQLTNPGGMPGEGRVEKEIVFSGKTSLKIIPLQRYHPNLAGWNFRIREKPALGEYRYVRFAWKAEGCNGLMFQLLCEKDWIRYLVGKSEYDWPAKPAGERMPAQWTVVTRDLYADFGDMTLTGFGPTVFGGSAGYFDHVYLGRTVEDLDRIDVTGFRQRGPVRIPPDELEELWKRLCGDDASQAYRAFWKLVADPNNSPAFLGAKLRASAVDVDAKQVRLWLVQLDDDDFPARQDAARLLGENLQIAEGMLRRELERGISPESRNSIEAILKNPANRVPRPDPIEKGVRALEYIGNREARKCLEELAKGADGSRAARAARAAMNRMDRR